MLTLLAAGMLFAPASSHAVAGGQHGGPASGRHQEAVAVEVLGFAIMDEGKELDQAHGEAILDARRNALAQAHVLVQRETHLKDMRLHETLERTRSTGYVERMNVLEAGVIEDTDPPVYRVRARAVVRAVPAFTPAGQPDYGNTDQWRPVVALKLTSDLAPEAEEAFRSSLAAALGRCGVAVVEPKAPCPALVTEVQLTADAGDDHKATRAEWQTALDAADEADPSLGGRPVKGLWQSAEGAEPLSASWERLGVLMAQDALRLWAAPRRTSIVVTGCTDDEIAALTQALGTKAAVRMEPCEGSVRLVAEVALAGDPVKALQPRLAEAGLDGKLKPVSLELTRLAFELGPTEDVYGDTPPDDDKETGTLP